MTRFKLKLTLLVITILPLLISLGLWQLSRYNQKRLYEQSYESRYDFEPLNLHKVRLYEDPLYLPVSVTGRYDVNRYFLLDNQVHNGQAGYQLFMPFLTDYGDWLIINRGWIASNDRDTLPNITTDPGYVILTGYVYKPMGKPFLLAQDLWKEGWPKRIQAYDQHKISKALGIEIPFFYINLTAGQPGAELIRPMMMNLKSTTHLGYAFQWFVMAIVLLIMYFFQMRSTGKETKIQYQERGNNDSQTSK